MLRRSALLVLVLTLISALDPPKSSAELPNSSWSLCKALSLDRECYSRFIVRNPIQHYSRFITRNSTQWYCCAEVVSPVLKVESGLRLFDAMLVASYLLLLAGDISENPGPETRSVNGETGNLLNIPVVTSNRLNYSRPFNRPTARSLFSRVNPFSESTPSPSHIRVRVRLSHGPAVFLSFRVLFGRSERGQIRRVVSANFFSNQIHIFNELTYDYICVSTVLYT